MDKGGDVVRYISVMPLESTVMIRIAAKLWELQCSQESIDFYHAARSRVLAAIQSKVLDRLFALPLPKQIKREITQHLTPIGQRLLDWLDPENFDLGLRTLGRICWTNEGTVDARKTIRSIFDSHKEDQSMFIAISKACVEDLVEEAWSKMPEYVKDANSNHNRTLCKRLKYNYHFVMYWICFCKGELSRLIRIIKKTDDSAIYKKDHSVYKNMFDLSVWTANELAAKYFWRKLTEQEKNTNVMVWIDHLMKNIESWNHSFERKQYAFLGILYFLLGQMNAFEQQRVFQKYGEEILESLLFSWQWRKYFLETAYVMFPFLEDRAYVQFMSCSVLGIEGGSSMTSKLFREVWCASPLNMKLRFVEDVVSDSCIGPVVFDRLVDVDDLDTLKLIMSCASAEERKELIISSIRMSENFIHYAINNLVTIDEFLGEMLSSERDLSLCKSLLEKHFHYHRESQLLHSEDNKAIEDFLKYCSDSKTKTD